MVICGRSLRTKATSGAILVRHRGKRTLAESEKDEWMPRIVIESLERPGKVLGATPSEKCQINGTGDRVALWRGGGSVRTPADRSAGRASSSRSAPFSGATCHSGNADPGRKAMIGCGVQGLREPLPGYLRRAENHRRMAYGELAGAGK